MTERSAIADAHAYVDNCLPAEARRAFEARLDEDPELRRRVETWQAQNEAIRAAYDVRLRPPAGRPAEGPVLDAVANLLPPRRGRAPGDPAWGGARAGTWPPGAMSRPRARAMASPSLRLGLILALSLGLLTLSGRGGPADPRGVLGAGGRLGLSRLWRRFGRPSRLRPAPTRARSPNGFRRDFGRPATRGEPRNRGMEAARRAHRAGTASAAAFIVWETPEASRAGLLIEPLDAPLALPAKAARGRRLFDRGLDGGRPGVCGGRPGP